MQIKSHSSSLYLSLTAAGAVVLAVMTAALYFGLRQDVPIPTGMVICLVPFVLVAAALTFFGIRGLLGIARYGAWTLEIPDSGGVIGGTLAATLRPRQTMTPKGELTCNLLCSRTTVSDQRQTGLNTAKDRDVDRVEHVTLWDKTWTERPVPIDAVNGMPMQIVIPPNMAATEVNTRDGSGVRWRFTVLIPTDDISHQAMFDIPVRREGVALSITATR